MKDNCYLLLELEFDPPVDDQTVIDQRIEEKSRFWSTNSTHFKKGAEYKKYLEMLPEIRRIMSDSIERKKQAEDACNIMYAQIDKPINILKTGKKISKDIAMNIARKNNVSFDTVKKRAEAHGIEIIDDSKDASEEFKKLYEKYYKAKPKNAVTFESVAGYLKSLNKDNFYDFLNPGNMRSVNTLPFDKLKQLAQEKKKKDFYKNDANSSSGKKVCEACELAFKDESSKTIYDEYLAWCKRKSILDEAEDIASLANKKLLSEQADYYIGQLTGLFKDRTLAKNVFIAFCKVEGIIIPSFDDSSKKKSDENIKICRCGCINDVSDGRALCKNCGEKLVLECPKCGVDNDANIKVCKCGFKFENIDKALSLINLAQTAIGKMDFEFADVCLTDAEKYLPRNSKAKEMRELLKEFKQRIGDVPANMRKAIQKKRYYEANKLYAVIQKTFPEFRENDLDEISTIIETAHIYYNKAKSSNNENDIIENCIKAYENCCDYPGIRELISRYPPQMPTNLRISPDGNTKTNILSWSVSTSHGNMYYSIVRKKGAIPVNNTDGDLVGRVNIPSFNDSTILPGVFYYYAVFAERAGVYSKPLTSTLPVVNLFEISNVTIATGDSILQLEWDPVPSGSTVELFRNTDDGKEEYINSNNSTGYLDSGLKNDNSYHYRVRLIYNVNGQKQMTRGITISGIPTKLPNAIENLSVKPIQENIFQAIWENPENYEVQLYCSTDRSEYRCGEIVPLSILDSKMRKLAVTKATYNSGTFQFKGDGLLYVTAVVVKSGSAVIGTIAHASREETVTIRSIAVVNDKINIFIDLPKGATGFVVLYRLDQYPIDINDENSIRKYIPLKQYEHDDALVIEDLKPENYYFSVFAEFTRDGEKDYSSGTDYLFANASKEVITYSISLTKKLLGFGEKSVKIGFEAENESFILPDIDILSAVGHTPIFKASTELFYSIPSQPVTGFLQVKISLPKNIKKELYIKAFLKNETLQSSYQLQPKVNSISKIS